MDPKFHSKVSQNYNVQNVLLSTATSTLNVSWVKTTARYNAGELKQTLIWQNLILYTAIEDLSKVFRFLRVLHCSKFNSLRDNHQKNFLFSMRNFSFDYFAIFLIIKESFLLVFDIRNHTSCPSARCKSFPANQDRAFSKTGHKAYLEESHGCSIFNCPILYLCLLGQIISRVNRGFHTFHCQKGG